MTLITDSTQFTEQFLDVRSTTDLLASRLSAEDQTPQSMPDASPAKWHRAHTTWFFEEFILRPDPGYHAYDPSYRFLFNSYYEAVGPRHPRPQRGLVTRPGITDIARYREYVQDAVVRALDAGRLDDRALELIELGCNHEQQHQELLLMDIKHLFATNAFAPAYVERPADADVALVPQAWRSVRGGVTEIGHDDRSGAAGFAYDNEGPRHRVYLEDFEIAERAVTNADWLEFMADGGYRRPDLWLSDGWAHLQSTGWDAPGYWDDHDGAMDDVHPVRTPSRRRGRARVPRVLLRGRRVRPLGRRPAAHRVRMGSRCPATSRPARTAARRRSRAPRYGRLGDGRRRVGVDGLGLSAVPGFRPGQRRGGRVQRQVHVRSARLARRECRDAGRA